MDPDRPARQDLGLVALALDGSDDLGLSVLGLRVLLAGGLEGIIRQLVGTERSLDSLIGVILGLEVVEQLGGRVDAPGLVGLEKTLVLDQVLPVELGRRERDQQVTHLGVAWKGQNQFSVGLHRPGAVFDLVENGFLPDVRIHVGGHPRVVHVSHGSNQRDDPGLRGGNRVVEPFEIEGLIHNRAEVSGQRLHYGLHLCLGVARGLAGSEISYFYTRQAQANLVCRETADPGVY